MYERVGQREEPLYQNSGSLAVIGHGIGRIERHLSSSCGSIDHYNVGHYAVLSHAHVNQMMVNSTNGTAGTANQVPRDGVKSFFSCLGGESSQSLSNINGADPNAQQPQAASAPNTVQRPTGAIPKTKNKPSNKVSPKPAQATANIPIPPPMPTNNRISKSSLQYLLLNKWLPLGPDYKIIDFNFMFSRNCSNDADQCENGEGVVQFNGQAEMVEPGLYQPQREYPTMNPTNYPRVIRNTPHLSRLRECEAESGQYDNAQRNGEQFRCGNAFRARSESPSLNGPRARQQEDAFRNWSFNFENNSFKPAGAVAARDVRRITDGTLAPKDFQEQNPRKELPSIIVEQQESSPQEPQPSTSKSTSPSVSEHSEPTVSSSNPSMKTGEMKKSENYENLASLQEEAPAQNFPANKQRKKKSTESQSSDSVTLAEEDEDVDASFDELESDID